MIVIYKRIRAKKVYNKWGLDPFPIPTLHSLSRATWRHQRIFESDLCDHVDLCNVCKPGVDFLLEMPKRLKRV